METTARLIPTRLVTKPTGVVLVLHGGASRGEDIRVSPTQLSVLRMIPIARRIARVGHGRIAVFRLLNSTRGWDASHTPVDDVTWALQQLRDVHGFEVPVCLVGHSLGARAAILSSRQPEVRSVVALASFVYPQDGTVDARGRQILFVHGTRDRIAPMARAEAAARGLERTAHVQFRRVEGGKHAMLRQHRRFDVPAAEFALQTLTAGPSVNTTR